MNRGILAIVTVIIAIIAWVIALGAPDFLSWKKQKHYLRNILTTIILTSLLFFYPIRYFSSAAIKIWNMQSSSGYIPSSVYSKLGGIHILFLLMFAILVITLWSRLFCRFSKVYGFSVFGSIVFLICINISFFYTIPRNGDDSFAWILLLPCFFFADIILIATIFVFTFFSIIRQIRSHNTETEITENPAALNEE